MMEPAALEFVRSLGSQWLSLVFVTAWIIYKTGIVQSWFGARTSERAQLSDDQQAFVDNLQREITRLDRRLDDEREACAQRLAEVLADRERRLAEVRADCDRETARLRTEVETLIRGEARWRHLTGNLAQYVAALQKTLREAGIVVPRFGGWDQFIAEGGDPMMAIGDN